LQATVATSSTKAEFMAAVSAAKVAKYLWSVLHELSFGQSKLTPLYVDNQAAIAMVNERKPTPCSQHIHIQHFAIQEWRADGDIELHHIPGTINASDQATKALGWTLHSCHVRRSDKICMMMTRLACNWAIESSYWRMDNNSDVGLLTGYVLYQLPVDLEFMDLDTFPHWFGLHPSLLTSW
jgi:hypothetical protein